MSWKQISLIFTLGFIISFVAGYLNILHLFAFQGYHVDITFSYIVSMLGNFDIFYDHSALSPHSTIASDLFTMNSESTFDYSGLYNSVYLRDDVHPYLYYFLLHTAFSLLSLVNGGVFTPESLLMVGFIINCLSQGVASVLIFLVGGQIFVNPSDRFLAITTIIYLIFPNILDYTLISRMYILVITCFLAYVYCFNQVILTDKLSYKISLLIVSFIGFNLHFFFAIYVCLLIGMYFLHYYYSSGYVRLAYNPIWSLTGYSITGMALLFVFFPHLTWNISESHQALRVFSRLPYGLISIAGASLLAILVFAKKKNFRFPDYASLFHLADTHTKLASPLFIASLATYIFIRYGISSAYLRYIFPSVLVAMLIISGLLLHYARKPRLTSGIKIFVATGLAVLIIYHLAVLLQAHTKNLSAERYLGHSKNTHSGYTSLSESYNIVVVKSSYATPSRDWSAFNIYSNELRLIYGFFDKNLNFFDIRDRDEAANFCEKVQIFDDFALITRTDSPDMFATPDDDILECLNKSYTITSQHPVMSIFMLRNFSKKPQ